MVGYHIRTIESVTIPKSPIKFLKFLKFKGLSSYEEKFYHIVDFPSSTIYREEETNYSEKDHAKPITSVAVNRNDLIASGSYDSTIRLWNRERLGYGEGNATDLVLRGHKTAITSLAFSYDGKTLISGSEDGMVRLWDVQDTAGEDHWETLLKIACDRLRYHPVFRDPQTKIEKAACETCQKYF